MMQYTLKKIPYNWYELEIKYSIELLEVFIKNIESQIALSIENFERKQETLNQPDKPHLLGKNSFVEHEGLNNRIFNLEGVFLQYFPNLQRKSAFISLYSFLEHELDGLCDLYRSTENYKIEINDFKDLGIDRSTRYLEKVAQLPINKGDIKWEVVKNIQKIRNIIIHNDGNLTDASAKSRHSDVKKYIQDNNFLSGETEIMLKDGFLFFVLNSFDIFFRYLDELIKIQANNFQLSRITTK